MFASTRKRVGEDEATFGVGVIDLDGETFAAGNDVARAEGVSRDGVLHDGEEHLKPHIQFRLHDELSKRERMRRAAHVFLHHAHSGGRFDIETAGVERNAFADERDARRVRIAPGDMHKARRLRCGAADGVDQGIILREQRIASDNLDLRAVFVRNCFGCGLQRVRSHVVCRRVDEIARKPGGFDHACGFGHVRAFGRRELWRRALALLVAVERIRPEAPCNRGCGGVELPRREGDAIVARRQVLRQRAHDVGIGLVADAEQHALYCTVSRWNEQNAPVLRLEVVRGREGAAAFQSAARSSGSTRWCAERGSGSRGRWRRRGREVWPCALPRVSLGLC